MFLVLALGLVAVAGAALVSTGDLGIDTGADEVDDWTLEETESQEGATEEETVDSEQGILADGRSGDAGLLQEFLYGGEGGDTLIAGSDDVLFGGAGADIFDLSTGGVAYLQDYETDDLIVVSHGDEIPTIGFDQTDDGISILADGYPIAILSGVFEFEPSSIVLSHYLKDAAVID